jgi:hypothetical protein
MAYGHNVFVAFDLVHPLDNYERLARTLATLGTSVKIGSMLWYLDSPRGAREIDAAMKSACNPGDSMIVVDASTNFAVLHNLPVPGAQLRRFWNSLSRTVPAASALAPAEPLSPAPMPMPRAAPPPEDISDDIASRLR